MKKRSSPSQSRSAGGKSFAKPARGGKPARSGNRDDRSSRGGSSQNSRPKSFSSRGGPEAPRKQTESKELLKKYPRLVTGHHAVIEALKLAHQGDGVLWLEKSWESSNDLRELEKLAVEQGISIDIKSDEVLRTTANGHQGSCYFTRQVLEWDLTESYNTQDQTLLILDGVEDPHNLGAILRTAWLLGVSAVIIPQDRAVGLTSTVHKVACGGAEHVPVVIVPNIAQFIEEAKKYEFWVFGLSHKAEKEIHQIKFPERIIWVLGAEDAGIRITNERVCDELVKLPQKEKSASFNVSNAAAMALFETARQKTAK